MVKNGPRNMKFGTNVVCTVRNKNKYNKRSYLENLAGGPEGIFRPEGLFHDFVFS